MAESVRRASTSARKRLEVFPPHAILELETLDPCLRQALGPVPRLELPQRQPAEHGLVAQEGEQGAWGVRLQVLQLAVRRVDGALARRMSRGVQRHRGDRVRERVEERDGIAQDRKSVV